MSKREALGRYSLIVNKLRKQRASFDEINVYLELESEIQSYNFTVSKRTFQRDLAEIRSIYNIDIKYDRSSKQYYVQHQDNSDYSNKLLETFDLFQALNLSDRLSNHIHFEDRKPQGTEHMHGLLHAIQNRIEINLTHKKYWNNEVKQYHIKPFALKEFNNRWYLFGMDIKAGFVKTFGMDRIDSIEFSRQTFDESEIISVDLHFKYSFGIIGPEKDKNPDEVIISFTHFQGKFIKALPLHHTQEKLIDNKSEYRIRLKLNITHDFIMELLSYGENLKVIEPKSLVVDMKERFEKAAKRYE